MINDIIAHLQQTCPSIKRVEPAFTLKEYPDLENGVPAIYVAPLGGGAEPSELANRVRQVVTQRVMFQIASPVDLLETAKQELMSAILGKHVAGSFQPFQLVKEEPLDVKPNLWWWSVEYAADYIIRAT